MKTTAPLTRAQVLGEISEMITTVLGDYAPDIADIAEHTRLGDDLEMESIDLVTLAGLLAEWYGPEVNLAGHLAELELDQIIELTVGDLVAYVVSALTTGTGR